MGLQSPDTAILEPLPRLVSVLTPLNQNLNHYALNPKPQTQTPRDLEALILKPSSPLSSTKNVEILSRLPLYWVLPFAWGRKDPKYTIHLPTLNIKSNPYTHLSKSVNKNRNLWSDLLKFVQQWKPSRTTPSILKTLQHSTSINGNCGFLGRGTKCRRYLYLLLMSQCFSTTRAPKEMTFSPHAHAWRARI